MSTSTDEFSPLFHSTTLLRFKKDCPTLTISCWTSLTQPLPMKISTNSLDYTHMLNHLIFIPFRVLPPFEPHCSTFKDFVASIWLVGAIDVATSFEIVVESVFTQPIVYTRLLNCICWIKEMWWVRWLVSVVVMVVVKRNVTKRIDSDIRHKTNETLGFCVVKRYRLAQHNFRDVTAAETEHDKRRQ